VVRREESGEDEYEDDEFETEDGDADGKDMATPAKNQGPSGATIARGAIAAMQAKLIGMHILTPGGGAANSLGDGNADERARNRLRHRLQEAQQSTEGEGNLETSSDADASSGQAKILAGLTARFEASGMLRHDKRKDAVSKDSSNPASVAEDDLRASIRLASAAEAGTPTAMQASQTKPHPTMAKKTSCQKLLDLSS